MLTKQDKQYLEERFTTKEYLEENYYNKKYLDDQFSGIFNEFTRVHERLDEIIDILKGIDYKLTNHERRIKTLESVVLS